VNDPTAALAYLAEVDTADKPRAQLRRQAIRDSRTAGAQITEIAATLGIRNRAGLYEILEETPPPPTAPAPRPVIFVRGAGVDPATWAQVVDAMHTRGWPVVRDRTQAWHLARGRVPVVLVDITHAQPSVGLVKARYDDNHRLELPFARTATHLDALDLDKLALTVIDHLTAVPAADKQELSGAYEAPPDKSGVTTRRFMSFPEQLWEQVQQAVADGCAPSPSQLAANALNTLMTKLERKHGGPFPPVDRLPTGRRTLPVRGQAMRPHSLTLDQVEWARARTGVAGGAAVSMPALFVRALQEYLTAKRMFDTHDRSQLDGFAKADSGIND